MLQFRTLAIALPIIGISFPIAQDTAQEQLPEVNRKVIEFVDLHMDEKVGRGECWDLAAGALDHADADWDGRYDFGEVIEPRKAEILPGDIVQFENVLTRNTSGNVKREESFGKHTAIIHRVHDKGVYSLAHQNTDVSGRTVGVSRFILNDVVRGKVIFHRPRSRS